LVMNFTRVEDLDGLKTQQKEKTGKRDNEEN